MLNGRTIARRAARRGAGGFSLLELVAVIAIVAILLGLLLPLLMHARSVSRTTVCANNLRQIGVAWQAYLGEHERFPTHGQRPDWQFGGVRFIGPDRVAVLDESRPLNEYLQGLGDDAAQARTLSGVYRCPSDLGIWRQDDPQGARTSLLEGQTCYDFYGNSYRGNHELLSADHQPSVALADLQVSPGRLLLLGDPVWYFSSRDADDPEAALDASWHGEPDGGNMAAADGSVRYRRFSPEPNPDFTVYPRAVPGSN